MGFVWAVSVTLFLGNVGPPMPHCVILWPSLRIGTVRLGLAGLDVRSNLTNQILYISYIDNEHTDPKFLKIQQWGVQIHARPGLCRCYTLF